MRAPPWRPVSILDEWVRREARPISIKQLEIYGRNLTESRIINSANYVQTELPTRLAHRIRDMQTLPYVVVANPHISQVYELYYKGFEAIRRIGEIENLDDNERLCKKIRETLTEHLTTIPKLTMGILECRDLMNPEDLDKFMNTVLRSRISRRVIAQHHLALSHSFSTLNKSCSFDKAYMNDNVGEVFLKCNASTVIKRCMTAISTLCFATYGTSVKIPSIQVKGHLTATFPYILSHLEYIIGEILRNSIQGIIETHHFAEEPPPIEVTICETPQHIKIRVSDRGGGIEPSILPYLWSFSTGPRSTQRLNNLSQVPKMAATIQQLFVPYSSVNNTQQSDQNGCFNNTLLAASNNNNNNNNGFDLGSIRDLSERPSNLRLGMGLPLSKIYAEYWAGYLEIESMEGYGVDAYLGISKLGNQNEQLTTRASIDAV
ncbi:kinase 2, mitochondrial [Erysiphe neolycopersici]|uniref:Protein-serine/threonine kinase n=1 Tax=Erysiphe neolycopersici TaxID=212602 RepID=A0A420HI26_9PEZI|nr:kinase 2, mitochondrial [Erysiphe neolycopersici]